VGFVKELGRKNWPRPWFFFQSHPATRRDYRESGKVVPLLG
jgi:hypothetical protein